MSLLMIWLLSNEDNYVIVNEMLLSTEGGNVILMKGCYLLKIAMSLLMNWLLTNEGTMSLLMKGCYLLKIAMSLLMASYYLLKIAISSFLMKCCYLLKIAMSLLMAS